MAVDKKISQLDETQDVDVTLDDLVALVDMQGTPTTKRATLQQIKNAFGVMPSNMFPNGWQFITSDMLDDNGDYIISPDDIGKILIFFIDRVEYPNFTVKIPETIGADEDVNSKSIYYQFIDGGKFKRSYGSPNVIYPLSLLEAKNTDESESGIVSGETIHMMLFNQAEDSNPFLIMESAVIYEPSTDSYKTESKYFFDKTSTERIIELGTVTFADINSAPATSIISLILDNDIPSGFYIDTLFIRTDEPVTDGSSLLLLNSATTGYDVHNILGDTSSPIYGIIIRTDDTSIVRVIKPTPPTGFRLWTDDNPSQFTLYLGFDIGGGEVNPQNLTTGSIIIKALIKKFPNI